MLGEGTSPAPPPPTIHLKPPLESSMVEAVSWNRGELIDLTYRSSHFLSKHSAGYHHIQEHKHCKESWILVLKPEKFYFY